MTANLPDRFLDKVAFEPNTGCWLWLGALNQDGYGVFRLAVGRMVRAHRYAYEVVRGPVPDGLQLDHFKCDTPSCANPFHVRPVTARENTLRSRNPCAVHARKTHCHAGHPLTPDNLSSTPGKRECRKCRTERDRRGWLRKKVALAAISSQSLPASTEEAP